MPAEGVGGRHVVGTWAENISLGTRSVLDVPTAPLVFWLTGAAVARNVLLVSCLNVSESIP